MSVPLPPEDLSRPVPEDLAAVLGPFIAWLATRERDDLRRTRHREIVEGYLRWAARDRGGLSGRRRRFEEWSGPSRQDEVKVALDLFGEHRAIIAVTRVDP